jgi:glutathione S-transferase
MNVYFSPLACSLASRIAIYEAGAEASFHRVDTKAGRTAAGDDYRAINAMGMVPALKTEEGEVLTENPAVLLYIADRYPDAALAPAGFERYRLQQWLSFIGTELHKVVFTPLLSARYGEEAKAHARAAAAERLAYLDAHLDGRPFLLDAFSIADAYLVAVLNWARAVAIDLKAYPAITAYRDRLAKRPSVARAMAEEFALYQAA